MKTITIISSSFRDGNSKALAMKFKEGAEYAGNTVRMIELKDMSLKFCLGCLYCQKTGVCALKDDINPILDTISNSDVLVFASPIYYYGLSGQLKTFLDRMNPLYVRDNRFTEVYLLCSCADTDPLAMEKPKAGIEGWVSCFPGTVLQGVLCATGVNEPKDVANSTYLENAYLMGRNA